MTARKSSYRSLASLERDLARCRACVEAGYPLESLPVRAPGERQRAYMFGQAPGVVEGEERLPWRGRAGRVVCHKVHENLRMPGFRRGLSSDRMPALR